MQKNKKISRKVLKFSEELPITIVSQLNTQFFRDELFFMGASQDAKPHEI
ncbi:hypothetical protein Desor_4240 [Desulfosporosinus orientis DSM 765]|uniref:Uncharacterized protein n=1 Tax=Desulfosporosinus orientis (strain ATCC 19365 / DSM 765 / NCIMB 8382 / VKM B-1628 / Singapore I) TaxID=768706 RepID=G7WIU8_DESOD|nr:hypothetical protein Desor_4240 [Desulfosporosinus orientis DSM 765]